MPLGSFSVSLESVKKIFDGLESIVDEQSAIDLTKWQKIPNQTDEQFAEAKANAQGNAYRVTLTVYREDGSEIFGSSRELFESSPGDPLITHIYMTNTTALAGLARVEPANYFHLRLDFSQPPLMDAENVVSSPTLNLSSLSIGGIREGWLAGVEKVVARKIDRQHNIRHLLHGSFVYDYGLLLLGVPFCLYLSWAFSGFVESTFADMSGIIRAAAYVYIFVAGLWVYRFLFSYTKWAFPLVELSEQTARPRKHRRWWWSLMLLLAGKVFWGFFDPYLTISRWFGT